MEGLTGITLCATMDILAPKQDHCDQLALLLGECEPAKPWQMMYLYTVLYITGFGAAGIRPCVSSFGADQFDERSKDYKSHLDRFFNFFYLSVTIGAIVAFTAVVYIQIKLGWGFAFGSLALAMGISNLVFFIGTPLYRHRLPGGSPLTRVAQVLVAAYRKRNAPFSSSELIGLYEVPGKQSAIKGSGKIAHTNDFRYLFVYFLLLFLSYRCEIILIPCLFHTKSYFRLFKAKLIIMFRLFCCITSDVFCVADVWTKQLCS